MSNAPRPLPPYAHAAEPGDDFVVPVFNRAAEIIGYRHSVRTLRTSDIECAHRLGIEARPFRQPIAPGADENLRLLLVCAGVFRDSRPDWAWAPLEQAHRTFGVGAPHRTGPPDFEALVSTVLPDEFMGVDVTGRDLRRDGLRVSAFGMTYEIRDRFRYVALRPGKKPARHIAEGAGWTREAALADARRRCPAGEIEAVVATPGLLRALHEQGFGEHGLGDMGICICGFFAMLWGEVNAYQDEYWDYHFERLGWR